MNLPALRRWRVLLPALLFCVIAAAWLGLRQRLPQPPPGLVLHTLQGEQISLGALRGRVALVTFWATSCAICLREMPQLVDLHDDLGSRGLALIAVAMPYDPAYRVAQYATTRKLPFTVALDLRSEAVQGFGGIAGTPTAFLIGKDGRILERIVGAPDFAKLRARIEAELSAPA
jgi:thiol-disulfide isomerase/thioredoxin